MLHQLQNVTIRAFRQLKDVELPSLGRVNLLVGVNNSGKTSLLEAIAVHCRPLDPLHWIAVARQREVKSSREPALDAVRWLFPQECAEPEDPYYDGEVRIESTGRYPGIETRAHYEGVLGEPDEGELESSAGYELDDEEDGSGPTTTTTSEPPLYERGASISLRARVLARRASEFGANQNGFCTESFSLWEDKRYISHVAPSNLRLPVAMISPFAHRVRQFQVSKFTEATLMGRKFNVVEIARLIDPDIENLEILSRTGIRPALYIRHARTGFTPVSALGDGVRRVLAIALELASAQSGVLLIDEIETAIHKDALTTVFQWLVSACNDLDVQLFATTHSLEAIDALLTAQIDSPQEVVAFHLPEAEAGATKRFDGDILDNLRFERGLDIR